MRLIQFLVLGGLGTLSCGCGLIKNATRNLVHEPAMRAGECQESHRDSSMAADVWRQIESASPGQEHSPHYVKGFKDGFADYLYSGGTGAPPAVPPWHLRTYKYQNPEGHRAVQEWYAGFADGAAVAAQSGYRQWVTVASSAPPPHDGRLPAEMFAPGAPLPMPRKAPSEPEGNVGISYR